MNTSQRMKALQSLCNDDLYDDIANFMEIKFENIDDFYNALAIHMFHLEKKYDIHLSPFEYIFIMRGIGELEFKEK